MAPGVRGKVTLIDCTVYGEIRNFGTAEVIFESGTAEPEKPDIQPSEVYTPGTLLGRTITYGGKEVPLYCDRSLNTFADLDFAWSLDKPDRLEYLG